MASDVQLTTRAVVMPRTRRRSRSADSARPAWMEKPSRLGITGKVVVVTLICAATIYPFLTVISTSLSDSTDIANANGLVLFPLHPTFAAYETIFSGGIVTSALVRSMLITVIGTLCSLAATVGMAYGLSRRDLAFGKFILLTALFTMLFTPGIIPSFLMVKQLGLLGSYAALVLPTLISAFNLVVVRSFFMGLPQELFEAARIDGAGDFRILVKIVLPLSKGVLAVVGLFYAVAYWNAFFNAMLYLNSDMWPLSMILRQYVLLGSPLDTASVGEISAPSQAIQMAVVVISVIPILLVYPFLQKYFTKGVLTGAVKG
ncbi:carbohydrate ABC transporter permease [Microbacterium sp. Au-Mic1]|uniref:carbohydrate ABC transporter permease n=2 Tax=Microbacterium TaxID=33882 RepID=UPI001E411CA2|nr:carbohydrate ABC transporter permease [Microbacterium sp. Au-Mic1]MCE4025803.1 carbohydrate ABC transporter permease [Microbacterium sp. Au-Mic1]